MEFGDILFFPVGMSGLFDSVTKAVALAIM